ncbi:hypothetical protein [Deinococcus navajonensis]|uniref:SnoaL-like domain-containing protein n=1 Tax=Deinococcus navajonensis TaxID=309884 RepID=A0ABV8XJ52_9DEIO
MTRPTTPESEVLRRATRALLQRDPDAFDAVCAPYFQGQAPRLLASLDEERPDAEEEFAFPSRYVLHLDNLGDALEEKLHTLTHDQQEGEVHPVHLISREVTADNLVGFASVEVYGRYNHEYDHAHQAELIFTLATVDGEIRVAHCWVNNYDGDDTYESLEERTSELAAPYEDLD